MRPQQSALQDAGALTLKILRAVVICTLMLMRCSGAAAQTEERDAPEIDSPPANTEQQESSPWLLAPVVNVNPKLGVSLGVLAGYLHYFDQKSRPSIFALTGQYTNTDSIIAGGFAKTSFDEDRQRLIAGLMYGYVKNDYDDYLGTGVPLQSNAELRSFISRYLYRIRGNWFAGVQGVYQNFAIGGETSFDEAVLDILGVKPYKSGGLGLVAYYDSRDDENMPTEGWVLSLNNMAYRDSLGGDDDFDVYRVDIRYFMPHGNGNVFAVRQLNHFTDNAPTQVRAPVQLRGYKLGQYNGAYMSHIEGEERLRLAEKWTATVFLGVACVYGEGKDCSDSSNLYPAAGAGLQYILKPKEGIVMNLEYAQGKAGNYGVYLKMGYAY
ncbi:MAG TPA: BamA/TamA family outer membrane protein [Burkholderiales bacterium]|nr:BamA/TamA family outer membrane protein [Burkholderiales bacterium]